MSDKGKNLAGAFAAHLIQSYLNDVHAASYPHTPEQVGGATYVYFRDKYEELQRDVEAGRSKEYIAAKALRAIRDYLANDRLSGKFACEASISANTAYLHFSTRMDIIDRLESGEDIQKILADLRKEKEGENSPPDDDPNQRLDGPSWLYPE